MNFIHQIIRNCSLWQKCFQVIYSLHVLCSMNIWVSLFTTEGTHNGYFSSPDMPRGPSSFCDQEAARASLSGEWCAVLGTSTTNVADACDFSYPLYLADGTQTSDLFSGTPNSDQFGNAITNLHFWSGTNRHCSDWTTGSGNVKGETGRFNGDGSIVFTIFNSGCSTSHSIVCVRTGGGESTGKTCLLF